MSDQPDAKTTVRLEEWDIGRLRVSPTNVKQHSETQVSQVVASIERFGFRDPIGVMPDGMIIEGEGRFTAAKRLEMRRVPVLIIEGLTEREARAYAITHNQTTANTGLDMTVVAAEFKRLDVGEDDYLSLGFTAEDVLFLQPDEPARGFDHNGHARDEDEKVPLPVTYVTRIEFADETEVTAWSRFIEQSKGRYGGLTIAERIVQFIQEQGHVG